MLNHITIMGRLVKDPEIRTTQSGVSVCGFTVAVDRDFSGKGEEKLTDFFDCTAWRGTADFIGKYFSKGRMIVVDGSLQNDRWQDKDGNNRVSAKIVANNVYFGDSKRNDSDTQNSNAGELKQQFTEIANDVEGDLPF